jgi:RHS repeat-associated protein
MTDRPLTIDYRRVARGSRIHWRRVSIANPSAPVLYRNGVALSPTKEDYTYDAEDRRISQTDSTWSATGGSSGLGGWVTGLTTLYAYDGSNLIAEINGATNKPIRTYAWGLDSGGGIGGLLSITTYKADGTVNQTYRPLYDGRGNVTGLVNAAGQVVATYTYSAFGTTTATWNATTGGAAADPNPFRFSTKYFDSQTGLYYYGYRFYSPQQGRWINRDPSGVSGGVNTDAFCGNDPVNMVDPIGLQFSILDAKNGGVDKDEAGVSVDADQNAMAQANKDVIYPWPTASYSALATQHDHPRELPAQEEAEALDRAKMAAEVYNEGKTPGQQAGNVGDWQRVEGERMGSNLAYVLYKNKTTGKSALVFKGTEPTSLKDWLNNFGQGAGLTTEQYRDAIKKTAEYALDPRYSGNLELIGHSLGGGLASAAALTSQLPATVFNPAGVNLDTVKRINVESFDDANANKLIKVYRVGGELLTTLQDSSIWANVPKGMPPTIGNITTLKSASGAPNNPVDSLTLHGMDAVIAAIKAATK